MNRAENLKIIIAACFFTLAGCVPSLHPLYTDEDRIKADEIVGTWYSDDKDEIYEISSDPDDPYQYIFKYSERETSGIITRDSTAAFFDVNLVKLGDVMFMDFYPGENESLENLNDLLEIHLIAAHTFAKFEVKGDTLKIWRMDPDWISLLFKENRVRIAHEQIDDQVILTASTPDLQKFMTKYGSLDEAYVEPEILARN